MNGRQLVYETDTSHFIPIDHLLSSPSLSLFVFGPEPPKGKEVTDELRVYPNETDRTLDSGRYSESY